MRKYKPGDRMRYVCPGTEFHGLRGTLLAVYEGSGLPYEVRWDNGRKGRHIPRHVKKVKREAV
jgi:hypothetical protein